MLDESSGIFTVTDLKQYIYCPRILFYQACLPNIRPTTTKMQHGMEAHQDEQKRAARRTLHQYHLMEGIRHFDVSVFSERWQLSGQIDEVVETAKGWFPIDYKLTQEVGYNHKIQLTAYALLLEEAHHANIKEGFLYLIPKRQVVSVKFTPKLRAEVQATLATMQQIVTDEIMPPPTNQPHKCVDCEFRRF
ncbi:MAG: CRISPR-associated protein Cas4, partial [Phototrophicaceae bacterium]